MTARWMPVASLVAVTLAPGTIPRCAYVTVPWSVAVDCAHSGAARSNVRKVADTAPNVFFGIRDSSLTGRRRADFVANRESRRTARQWTQAGASGQPTLARAVP